MVRLLIMQILLMLQCPYTIWPNTVTIILIVQDNYSDNLWDFKRHEIANNSNGTNDDNAPSFKYKANLIADTEADGTKKGVKILITAELGANADDTGANGPTL